MSENHKKHKLFKDFPAVSTEAWEEKIHQDLKGKSYEKKLIWNTPEGFQVKPYYREEDIASLPHTTTKPGKFPFVRGNKPNHNDWHIRQDIPVDNVQEANKKALHILNKGITSLGFHLNGISLSQTDFEALLKNVCTEAVELNFIHAGNPAKLVDLLKTRAKQENIAPEKLQATIDYAPLAGLATTGGFYKDAEQDMEQAASLVKAVADYPQVKVIGIHGEHYHNAGGTLVQELGFAMAEGEAYMTALTESGISPDVAAQAIKFNLAVGSVYFMEIAKVRAARMLWARIAEAYKLQNLNNAKIPIHSITSDWNKTVYDPYVNMIRTSTEAMSAVIGGAESLTVKPYDSIYRAPSQFSERIARNQQIILKEESHFDKVVDPAGGAYYIENLTASLAENAWNIFLEVQDKGGYTEAFRTGLVQEKISGAAQNRDMNMATRKKILLGTNQYPNANEVMDKDIPETVMQPNPPKKAKNLVAEPIVPYRGAMKFEAMRLQTDRSGKRPKVFMLKLGTPAMRTARSQFAANFFGCAGYQILDNLGFDTVEEGVQEAKKQQADVVVICSADEEYATLAPEAYKALKDDAVFVVAGYPKDSIEELKNAGIKHFIHLKSNLYSTLQEFQRMLGIAQ